MKDYGDILIIAAILIVGYFVIKALANAGNNIAARIPGFDLSSVFGDTVSSDTLNNLGGNSPTFGSNINNL